MNLEWIRWLAVNVIEEHQDETCSLMNVRSEAYLNVAIVLLAFNYYGIYLKCLSKSSSILNEISRNVIVLFSNYHNKTEIPAECR